MKVRKNWSRNLQAAFDDDSVFIDLVLLIQMAQGHLLSNKCMVQREFIEDRWGGSDEAKNLAHLKMFEETDSFELTICEYENLLDEIEYLKTVDLKIFIIRYGTDWTFFVYIMKQKYGFMISNLIVY